MESLPRTSGIYKIVCVPTKKVYVGSATNLYNRHFEHFKTLRLRRHSNTYLQAAWNKYGADAFEFHVIELVLAPFLLEREQYWIDKLHACNSRKGFNLRPMAGSNLGHKFSEESRQRLSTAMRGRVISEEHRRKLSEANRGKKLSLEVRQKLSEAHKGRPHSEEHRRNLNKTKIGKRPSDGMLRGAFERHAKRWVVTSPDGTIYYVKGLAGFCREHGLDASGLKRTAIGKRYKGWICRLEE